MAKASKILDWCVVRLGEDHNWWVDEVSDPIRWDVDGLSIVDPRQVAYLIELVEPLRDFGFDQDVFESAFVPFRIDKDLGTGRVRLKRVKDSLFESDEKLFSLPDIVDEENGPFADLLDHLTRCRVKMLNELFDFESKLTVDEVEDEIREDQNASFMEGKAIHCFEELTAILDYMPAGYEVDDDDERVTKGEDETADEDLPDIDEADEEALKNDASLKWDEEDEEKEKDEGEFGAKPEGAAGDKTAPGAEKDGGGEDEDEDDDEDEDEDEDEDDEEGEDDEDEDDDGVKKKSSHNGKGNGKGNGNGAHKSNGAAAKTSPAKKAPPPAKHKKK